MGQYKETAKACNDWDGYLRDGISDLMEGWEDYEAMASGASEVDRHMAKEELRDRYREWDGSEPTVEQMEAFADSYDAALRERAKEEASK